MSIPPGDGFFMPMVPLRYQARPDGGGGGISLTLPYPRSAACAGAKDTQRIAALTAAPRRTQTREVVMTVPFEGCPELLRGTLQTTQHWSRKEPCPRTLNRGLNDAPLQDS